MNIFDIAIYIGLVLFTPHMLNPPYIAFKAMRWQNQDKLIARALK